MKMWPSSTFGGSSGATTSAMLMTPPSRHDHRFRAPVAHASVLVDGDEGEFVQTGDHRRAGDRSGRCIELQPLGELAGGDAERVRRGTARRGQLLDIGD